MIEAVSFQLEPRRDDLEIDGVLRELTPDLLGYFARRLADREDAADCVAETLLIVWRNRSKVAPVREDLRRYSFGVARKVLSAAMRGRLRRHELADRLRAQVALQPESDHDADLDLRRALASLPRRDEELVLLVAWEGLSVADAGASLGLTATAARARYSRARRRLRDTLNEA